MNDILQNITNIYTLIALSILLVTTLTIKVLKHQSSLDNYKKSLILITISSIVILILSSIFFEQELSSIIHNKDTKNPTTSLIKDDTLQKISNPRINSPSFGNVQGNIKVEYNEQ